MQRGVSTPVGSGQGQAFIYDRSDLSLKDPKAPLLFDTYLKRAQADRLANEKQKADSAKSLKKLMDNPNEYWYRHEKELQTGMDELYNMGAEILTNNADPFTGTDPASMEFRKKRDRLEKLSKYSMQLKELHSEYFKKIDASGKEGPRYTEDSKKAVASYFETPLSALVDENKEPPRLELVEPTFSILQYDTDLAKGISATKKDGVSDTDIAAFAAKSLEDPKVNDAVYSQMQRLSKEGRKTITAMAQNQGMTPEAFLRYNQLRPHFQSGLDNFDFNKVEAQMKPGLTSSSIERGDVTTAVTKLKPARAEEAARLMVSSNPKYVQAGVASGRFGSPTNSFEENVEAAISWNKKRLLGQAVSKYTRSEDEDNRFGGYSSQEFMADRSEWLQTIRSGDNISAQEAGDYLKGVKLEDGSTIEKVEVVRGGGVGSGLMMNDADDNVIELTTVRTTKSDGKINEERRTIAIDRENFTDEYLLRLHDQAFSGPAKKNLFGQTERTKRTQVSQGGAYIPGQQQDNVPKYLNIIGGE
jgi:hypothetical protein